MGRTYNGRVLDMFEFEIDNFTSLEDVKEKKECEMDV
jgi:hypothetical protein